MKVYCEQCKKDISKAVDQNFEKIILGRVKCPSCGNIQGRFISESDMLLYLGICETIYTILVIIGIYIYDNLFKNWWLFIVLIIILVLAVIAQKNISRFVYKKEFIKLPISEQKDLEKNEKTRADINKSFMIYSLFSILAIVFTDYRIELLIGLIAITIASLTKFYLSIKQHKEANK